MLDVPTEIQKVRSTPEYQRVKSLLADREWRLDNLYWIRDEDTNKVRFVRNAAQRAYYAASSRRDLIPKARKIGFSTFIAILITDDCMFSGGTVAGIVDRSIDDACDKLAMVRFAYDNLPSNLKEANPLVLGNQKELAWANGSSVTVGTTYRGGTPSLLHVSEFGPVSVESPDVANEIKNGAMQAVPASGRIWVESTSHGSSGEFYKMVSLAQKQRDEGRALTPLDYKVHFFGWWMKPEYRVANNLVVISHDLREYFAEIAPELKDRHGIALDADQEAWYAKKHEQLGPDDIKKEFPSVEGELFYASLEGAYWRAELGKARREGRIGQPVPFDPTRRVNTFWDIGEDCTAILFHQTDGLRHRFVDYYEEEGGSLQRAVAVLDQKRDERGFSYDKHLGPHDLENRDWGNNAQTRKKTALDLGYKIDAVPRVLVKDDSIEAGRRMLNLSWFDSVHCGLLVERLENYRKKWNKALGVWSPEPVHDAASHPADALQQGAMGLAPEKPEVDRHRRRDRPKTSAWGA